MSPYANLAVDRDGPWVTVTLNRPDAMNALSRALVRELGDCFRALADDRDARVVILTGAGGRKGMSDDEVRAMLGYYRESFGLIDRCPKPVVAALNGVALGGGFELALSCDLRVAAPTALVGLPETSLAIIPGAGGTQRLPRLVGPGKAKELILLAKRFPAAEALALGLVTAVAEPGEAVVAAAKRLTEGLAHGAPIALAAALDAVDLGADLDFEAGLDLEARCYERTLRSSDRREALAAFAEKRKPVYKGE